MINKVFTVYDSKAEAYLNPFLFQNQGEAIRAFSDSVKDEKHPFSRHPEDYTLFYIADYDDSTGQYTQKVPLVGLGLALEYKSAIENDSKLRVVNER